MNQALIRRLNDVELELISGGSESEMPNGNPVGSLVGNSSADALVEIPGLGEVGLGEVGINGDDGYSESVDGEDGKKDGKVVEEIVKIGAWGHIKNGFGVIAAHPVKTTLCTTGAAAFVLTAWYGFKTRGFGYFRKGR